MTWSWVSCILSKQIHHKPAGNSETGMRKEVWGHFYFFLFKLGLEAYAAVIQQAHLNFATDRNGDKFQPQHAKLCMGMVSERLGLTLPCA